MNGRQVVFHRTGRFHSSFRVHHSSFRGMGRHSQTEIESFVRRVLEDGFCVLPGHFAREKMGAWRAAFAPLLERHVEREGHLKNRGPARYYVTLPFAAPFADPEVYDDDDVL